MSMMTMEQLDAIAARFRAMGDPLRLRILSCLMEKERTVGEVLEEIGTSQPNITRHLQALHSSGLVERRKEGNSVIHAVTDPMLHKLCGMMCGAVERDAQKTLKKLTKRAS